MYVQRFYVEKNFKAPIAAYTENIQLKEFAFHCSTYNSFCNVHNGVLNFYSLVSCVFLLFHSEHGLFLQTKNISFLLINPSIIWPLELFPEISKHNGGHCLQREWFQLSLLH